AAEEQQVFVNAVDDAAVATAYTGGVLRRGGGTPAGSTEGRAPAPPGPLREGRAALLPPGGDGWVRAAQGVRERRRAEGRPMAGRRPELLRALNGLYESKVALRSA